MTADFFRTLGIPLRDGRGFTDADDGRAAAGGDRQRDVRAPVPRRRIAIGRGRPFRRRSPPRRGRRGRRHPLPRVEQAPDPTFYLPIGQNDERWPFLAFLTWGDGDAAAAAPLVREAIRAADPAQAISTMR